MLSQKASSAAKWLQTRLCKTQANQIASFEYRPQRLKPKPPTLPMSPSSAIVKVVLV